MIGHWECQWVSCVTGAITFPINYREVPKGHQGLEHYQWVEQRNVEAEQCLLLICKLPSYHMAP